jgi:hypothetical protein
MISRLAQDSPEAAASLAASLDPAVQQAVTGKLADEWAGKDLSAALGWLQQLTNGPGKAYAFEGLLHRWAATDPRAAADCAMQTVPLGPRAGNDLRSVAFIWTQSNPQEALDWAQQQADGPARQLALSAVLEAWTRHAAAEAGAYVGSLPAGAVQDSAIEATAGAWVISDPAGAAAWLDSLSNNSSAQAQMPNAATFWAHRDPQAALAWELKVIQDPAISDGVKRQLLNNDQMPGDLRSQLLACTPDQIKQRLLGLNAP